MTEIVKVVMMKKIEQCNLMKLSVDFLRVLAYSNHVKIP